MQVKNQNAQNVYEQQVTLNGQQLTQPFLVQQDVAKGGTLVFTMGGAAGAEVKPKRNHV
ncbi:glycoside hydrolase domain-containing protein [Hymenobacter rubidus]|uniref:glycoside hydrolase domain-containing protein n=1 Tax=Hymenobacter rubidus TaxID=1441626 RepID=UPI00191FECB3